MSYSCFISFKKMNVEEVIPFLREYKKHSVLKLKEIAEENNGYMPYVRNTFDVPEKFSDVSKEKIEEAKNWAKCCVFQYKYFYVEKLGLLGVFGIPTCMRFLFDKTVYFQNSCDQDYPRETWEGIEYFTKIFDKWHSMTEEDFMKEYKKKNDADFMSDYENYQGERLTEKIDYYRRDFAYEEIWGNFESYLYDEEESIFFSLFGNYNLKEIRLFVKYCHEAYIEYWKEFEQEYMKKHPEEKTE